MERLFFWPSSPECGGTYRSFFAERKGERGEEQEELFDKMESDFDFDSDPETVFQMFVPGGC